MITKACFGTLIIKGDIGTADNGKIDLDKDCIYLEGYTIIPTSYYEKLIAFEPPTLMERFKSLFIK